MPQRNAFVYLLKLKLLKIKNQNRAIKKFENLTTECEIGAIGMLEQERQNKERNALLGWSSFSETFITSLREFQQNVAQCYAFLCALKILTLSVFLYFDVVYHFRYTYCREKPAFLV